MHTDNENAMKNPIPSSLNNWIYGSGLLSASVDVRVERVENTFQKFSEQEGSYLDSWSIDLRLNSQRPTISFTFSSSSFRNSSWVSLDSIATDGSTENYRQRYLKLNDNSSPESSIGGQVMDHIAKTIFKNVMENSGLEFEEYSPFKRDTPTGEETRFTLAEVSWQIVHPSALEHLDIEEFVWAHLKYGGLGSFLSIGGQNDSETNPELMKDRFDKLLSNGPPHGSTAQETTRALITGGLPLSAFCFNNADFGSDEFGNEYVIDIPATISVLMSAVYAENYEIITELVRAGADPLEKLSFDTSKAGFYSPFVAAANAGKVPVVKALLSEANDLLKADMVSRFLAQVGEPDSDRRRDLAKAHPGIVDVITYVSALKAENVVLNHSDLTSSISPRLATSRPF